MSSAGGRYTDAIVSRLAAQPTLASGKATGSKIDVNLARSQQEQLYEVLRECGVQVTELAPETTAPISNDWLADVAVVVNGTALLCRPLAATRVVEVKTILPSLAWDVFETPVEEGGESIVLNGSDVLFTGRELFVGVHRFGARHRHDGTNMLGAMQVARTFPDLPCVPISVDSVRPLKYYVTLAALDVLAVGESKIAQHIIRRIERESSFRYQTLSMGADERVNCIHVNGFTIYRSDIPEAIDKFTQLQDSTNVIGIDCGELLKLGGCLSQYIVFARKIKSGKSLA